jgi:hypothetical protein
LWAGGHSLGSGAGWTFRARPRWFGVGSRPPGVVNDRGEEAHGMGVFGRFVGGSVRSFEVV